MFQHNTEGGGVGLRAKLWKCWKLMRTRVAGSQWKVLVYGFAISWSKCNYYQQRFGADVSGDVVVSELRVLF